MHTSVWMGVVTYNIAFGREVCGDLATAEGREWLVTNGLGGYASGTLAGSLTRKYHGLLIAALQPPLGRTLLLTKFDETVTYGGLTYPLSTNRWAGGVVEPAGYLHLERFHLEGTTPVWTYACADALLEKRIWMEPGANTTYVRYDMRRGALPLALSIKAIVNYRDHHGNTRAGAWQPGVVPAPGGLRVIAFEGATPLYLLSAGARSEARAEWYQGYWLGLEAYRGLDPLDDNFYAGHFEATLGPGDSLTLAASTGPGPDLDGKAAYERFGVPSSEF